MLFRSGLTENTSKEDLFFAFLEAIGCLVRIKVDEMEKEGQMNIKELMVSGKLGYSNLLQVVADICQFTVLKHKNDDVNVLGGAFIAGEISRFWKTETMKKLKLNHATISPLLDPLSSLVFYNKWIEMTKRWQN